MTKPDCDIGTACGGSCISGHKSCSSKVPSTVMSLVKPSLTKRWSSAFTNAPADVRLALASLPEPIELTGDGGIHGAYSQGNGIYMGTAYVPEDAHHRYIFRHEYGHYIDSTAGVNAAHSQREHDFEVVTGGTTVADIQHLSKRHNTSVGKQLDKTADRLNIDRDALFNLYMVSQTSYSTSLPISSSPEFHAALRLDEQRILDMYSLNPKGTDSIMSEADKSLGSVNIVRDLASSITGNVVGFGHTDKYYSTGEPYRARNTEAFANLFSLHSSGDELAIKTCEYLAPHSYKLMKLVTSTV